MTYKFLDSVFCVILCFCVIPALFVSFLRFLCHSCAGRNPESFSWIPHQVRNDRKIIWIPCQARNDRRRVWIPHQVRNDRRRVWIPHQVRNDRKIIWIPCQARNDRTLIKRKTPENRGLSSPCKPPACR
jgi:hypothetical protein